MNPHGVIAAAQHAPSTFKIIFLLFCGISAWNALKKWRAKRFQELAENWPMTQGRVTSREIKERKDENSVEAFVAVLTYSYVLDGQSWDGTFRKEFDSSDEAGEWLDMLYEKDVPVHYNPSRPSRSTLLVRELPDSSAVVNQNTTVQRTMFSLDVQDIEANHRRPILAVASLIGLAGCAALHLVGLLSKPGNDSAHFGWVFGMQIYAIGVSGLAFMLDRGTSEGITTKRYREEMDAVAPENVRWLGKAIWVYGIGWFVFTFVQSLGFPRNSAPNAMVMFPAFQAIFLFEAYRMTQIVRWRQDQRP